MKKVYYLCIFILLGFSLYAQETIGEESMPQAGWTYIVSLDNTSTYSIPAGSQTAQSWDYSSLTEAYPKVPTYDSTKFTPYQSDFPSSTLYTKGPAYMYSGLFGGAPVGQSALAEGYMFWRVDPTGFWSEGFVAENGPVAYEKIPIMPNEMIIPLPGVLNATYSNFSSYQYTFQVNPSDYDTLYVSKTSKTFEYDAWGTLTTPYGTFNKVVRAHEYRIKADTVYIKLNGMTVFTLEWSRDTSNIYYYIDKDTEYPVLTTYADKNNVVQFTEYYKMKLVSTMGIKEEQTAQLSLYPNPFNNQIHFSTDIPESSLLFYNLEGRCVKIVSIENEGMIDVSDMHAGVYICKQYSKDGRLLQVQKLIK
ncbi:MAG: T9SS type A sorting domain-containing protein [Brumimicrobium sp.]|nr:T9SS type A sorting domain-containing protein [Brumimicrobium sp.]